jgi:hypothetical protein
MLEIEEEIRNIKEHDIKKTKSTKIYKLENIIIEYNEINKLYSFQTLKKQLLGNININDIIKYSISTLEQHDTFLTNIKLDDNKIKLIEKYICNTYQENNSIYIEFNSIEKSEFMTDPELLIQLNKDLTEFEEKNILNNTNVNIKIINIIRQMIYNLLDTILKLLYSLSYNKKGNSQYLLMKYSNAIVYKINQRIKYDLEKKYQNIINNNEFLKKIDENNKLLDKKIEILNKNISEQSDIITKLINESSEHLSSKEIEDTKIVSDSDKKLITKTINHQQLNQNGGDNKILSEKHNNNQEQNNNIDSNINNNNFIDSDDKNSDIDKIINVENSDSITISNQDDYNNSKTFNSDSNEEFSESTSPNSND